MSEFFKKQWIRLLGCFLFVALCVILYNIFNTIKDKETETIVYNAWTNYVSYVNSLTISGLVLIGIGGLNIVSRAGGFDIYSYMVGAKKDKNGKKETLYDYSERKKEKRKKKDYSWAVYMGFGIITLAVGIILYYAILGLNG